MNVLTCRCEILMIINTDMDIFFLRYGVILIVFYGFYIKPQAYFLSVLALMKT